jgi:hypothetical protein
MELFWGNRERLLDSQYAYKHERQLMGGERQLSTGDAVSGSELLTGATAAMTKLAIRRPEPNL